ncbi:MAG: hypothetical protein RI965_584 [Bacteroidota bacterium]|jgi:Fic-DOC domain mobile mystery protein B
MELNEDVENSQTPLSEEEREGLKLTFISSKKELNEFEQQNIEEAMLWLVRKSLSANNILTQKFICKLHERMFYNVWSWAGKFRTTDKNIGIHHKEINVALKILCDDVLYWINHKIFEPEEIAIRFKHKLVSIHCFPNGNGRHSRLMADIVIEKIFKQQVFTWGIDLKESNQSIREAYIKSIRDADQNNYKPLLKFSRS